MNIKEKLLRHKKMSIGCLVTVMLGISLGTSTGYTNEEYNSYLNKRSELVKKIELVDKNMSTKADELEKLNLEKNNLITKKDKLLLDKKLAKEKEDKEVAEKLELERLAKEKEEAEKLAQEEKQKREALEKELASNKNESTVNNSSNTNNKNNSVSTNSNNSNKGSSSNNSNNNVSEPIGEMVWKTATGKKYHRISKCGNTKSSSQISLSSAKSAGLTPCSKCY